MDKTRENAVRKGNNDWGGGEWDAKVRTEGGRVGNPFELLLVVRRANNSITTPETEKGECLG